MAEDKKQIGAKIDIDVIEAIRAMSEATGIRMAALIEKLLKIGIKNYE